MRGGREGGREGGWSESILEEEGMYCVMRAKCVEARPLLFMKREVVGWREGEVEEGLRRRDQRGG